MAKGPTAKHMYALNQAEAKRRDDCNMTTYKVARSAPVMKLTATPAGLLSTAA